MNKIFRIIWSIAKERWVVVAEKVTARSCCPAATVGVLAVAALLATGGASFALDPGALPTGGQITSGSGSIAASGSRMTVNQSSQQMIANWNSFNIGANAGVQFVQPNAQATALNRINDQNPSQILGSLSANGRVFLINPAGIVFGQSAQVDVGGLVGSSLNMLDSDFLAGRYRFTNPGSAGSILNQGSINAMPGGVVALIAPKVTNEGTITANSGSVLLAAANQVSLDFSGDGLISYTIDQGAVDALAENKGLIKADGGLVVMTAKAADSLTQAVVNNIGVIEAQTLENRGGRILLDGADGMATSSGTLSAQGLAAGETGGAIIVTGELVGLMGSAIVDASGDASGGTINIGGGFQGNDATIANAKKTIVDTDTVIRANAGTTGNGGEVVLWADDTNRYHGSIEAKGGALSGNGGQVEVSGKGWLDFQGQVNTTAVQGQGGSLLLDPTNIVVATADPGGATSRSLAADLSAVATNAAETSWITPTALVGLLNTANVTLQAYNDITVDNAIDASSNTADSWLTMKAGRSILINDNITLRGAFIASANDTSWGGTNRGAGAGDFTMSPGTNIVSSAYFTGEGITILVDTQNSLGTATIEGLRSTGISGLVSGNIEVTANSIDLRGGADSIVSTRILTFRPTTTNRPILVGAVGDGSQFALTDTELATVAAGTQGINIGSSGQTGGITLSGLISFKNSVTLYNTGAGGAITLDSSANVVTNDRGFFLLAGTGDAGTITQANGARISTGTGGLSLFSDVIALNGAANSIKGTGPRTFTPISTNRPMLIGGDDANGILAIDATELGTLESGYSSLTFGSTSNISGGVTLSGPLSFPARVTINNTGAGGSITVNDTPTVSGILTFSNGTPVTLNASVVASTVSFGGAVTIGADNLIVDAGLGTANFNSTVSHGANNFTVTANYVVLSGNWIGTGARILQPTTTTQSIGLAGSAGGFNLNATKLGYLSNDSPSSVTIGRSGGTGAITGAAFSFDDPLNLRGGTITQTGAWTLGSTSSFTAGASNITLDQPGNDFGGAVKVVSGNNVSLRDVNTLILDTSSVSGNLTLQTGGALTQTGDLAVTGTTSVTAGTNDITLNRLGNNFGGAVQVISGNNVSLRDTDALLLGASASTIGGNLTLQTGGALTQTGNLLVTGTTSITAGANDVTLNNTSNDFGGAVTVVSGKNVTLIDADTMTLGGVTSSGLLDIATKTGDLTLTGAITTSDATASAIKLNAGKDAAAGTAAGGNIIVSGGTVSTGAGGSATLYSGSVSGSTGLTALIGSGSGRFRYNSDETASNYTDALLAGSNAVYREKPTLTVTPGSLAITYGDATPFTTTIGTAYVNGDTSAGTISGTATWTFGGASSTGGKPVVGTHDAGYSNGLVSSLGYGFTDNGASSNELTVSKKDLNVSGLTASNKTYDTTNAAFLGGTAAVTALGTDVVTLGGTASGTFGDKTAADGKTVTVTGNTISGADSGNYNLIQQTGLTANISKKAITASGITASDKVYDTTLAATLATSVAAITNGATADDDNKYYSSDTVTLDVSGATGAFANKTAADGKAVTVSGLTLGGGDAGNYTITDASSATANISKADLSVTGLTASNKAYDATAAVTLGGTAAITTLGSDDVTIGGTASGTFADKNAGDSKAVTITGNTISGADIDNYNLIQQTGLTANISKADLSVTATDATKSYGQTPALTAFTSSGLQNGETIGSATLTSPGTAATANVAGSAYDISASNATGGTFSAGNYTITYNKGSLTVTPTALSVTATDATKTYGQTPTLTAFTSSGLQNGETIGSATLASAGTAATAGVIGSPYAITASNATGGTFSAGNYTITYHDGSLTVTPTALSVTATDASKTYGQILTLPAFTSSGLQNGETIGSVTLAGTGTAATANVAVSPYAISASNATGGTFSAGNYTITYNNSSLTVTPAALSVTATDATKSYGQTPTLTAFTSSGQQNGETIGSATLASAGTAATASVIGSPYAITASNATGGTFSAGNYTIIYHDGSLTVTPVADGAPVQVPLSQPQITDTASVMPPPTAISMTSTTLTSESGGTVSGDGITPDGTADRETSTGRATPGGNAGEANTVVASSTGIIIRLVSQPSSRSTGIITVAVPKTLASPGSSFRFPLPEQVSSAVERGGEVKVSLANGNPLPVWLRYMHASRTFVATDVPVGSLPIIAMVEVGGRVWTVEITELEK